jgi:hypothetical protein
VSQPILRKEEQALVDECIRYFDFEKVEKTMKALNWKWSMDRARIPTQAEMILGAQHLLGKVLLEYRNAPGQYGTACGGFEAEVFPAIPEGVPILKLRFVVEDWNTDPR